MRWQDGEEGNQRVGFFVHAQITEVVKALVVCLLEEEEESKGRAFCSDEMEEERSGTRRSSRRWKVLREKLKLKGIGCCGSSWNSMTLERDDMVVVAAEAAEEEREAEAQEECTIREDTNIQRAQSLEEEEQRPQEEREQREEEEENHVFEGSQTAAAGITEGSDMMRREATMNLAAALAAERHLRAAQEWQPLRVSLMSLLELEHENASNNSNNKSSRGGESIVAGCSCCCICMSREKGAAFIPCGHTFCRVCSRELWLSRGSCPLCNRHILEILDIF